MEAKGGQRIWRTTSRVDGGKKKNIYIKWRKRIGDELVGWRKRIKEDAKGNTREGLQRKET